MLRTPRAAARACACVRRDPVLVQHFLSFRSSQTSTMTSWLKGAASLRKRFLTGARISGAVSHPRPGQGDHRRRRCASLTQTLLGLENGIRCRLLVSQRPTALTGAPARACLRVDLGIELSLDTVD